MSPTDTVRDGQAWAARSAQLGQGVADARTGHRGGCGLALLMRKGMAAWMSSVEDEPQRRTATAISVPETSSPEGIERSLIDILATMTFATVLEIRHDDRSSFQSASAAPQA